MNSPACTNGRRHTWEWLKNVAVSRGGPRIFKTQLRGLYACKCGAHRLGASGSSGDDLRTVGPVTAMLDGLFGTSTERRRNG